MKGRKTGHHIVRGAVDPTWRTYLATALCAGYALLNVNFFKASFDPKQLYG